MNPQAAILGLDGVPIHLLEELAQRDVMPHMKTLMEQGCLAKMRSSLPANSAASWSSMITGVGPGTHGVYGFTDFIPGTYTVCYHSSRKLKAQPFWTKEHDRRVLVINLPAAYPAQPLNGTMITGFVSPQLEKAVYPPGLLSWLREGGYEAVESMFFHQDIPAPWREDIDEIFYAAFDRLMEQRS